jgi:hypothetical protein
MNGWSGVSLLEVTLNFLLLGSGNRIEASSSSSPRLAMLLLNNYYEAAF